LKEFGVLLVAWIALFHFLGNSTLGYVDTTSLFGWWKWTMAGISGEDHAYLMPLVVLGLLYMRRAELAMIPKRVFWPALVLITLALLLHVVGYVVQQARISVVAFALGLYGLTGLFWGFGWLKAVFLPFSLLAFSVPLGPGAEPLTVPLRLLATKIAAVVSHYVLGIEVIQRGNILLDATGRFQYEVAAACSGINSLTAIVAFAIIYSFLNFSSFWRIGVMLAAALPMAVLANVVRLEMIIAAAEVYGQAAGDYVHKHSLLSLLPYIPSIGGLFLIGRLLQPRADRPPKPPAEDLSAAPQQV
jgi:exosortase